MRVAIAKIYREYQTEIASAFRNEMGVNDQISSDVPIGPQCLLAFKI